MWFRSTAQLRCDSDPDSEVETVQTRPFGRTGHDSSVEILGSAGLKECSQREGDRVLEYFIETRDQGLA
jgi:hypothetical protein